MLLQEPHLIFTAQMEHLVAVRRHGRQLLLQRRYLHSAPGMQLNMRIRMLVLGTVQRRQQVTVSGLQSQGKCSVSI